MNSTLFILFRVLFNARFYYPVFAILQLDFGLTMTHVAILNAVWAASIVFLEVPSGALADLIGRKRMVVLAAILMLVEISLIAFVPLGNFTLIYTIWIINRILSGAAEAAASGADEALAYDSLPENQREELWPKVLSKLTTFSSLGFFIAMLVGAALYDAHFVNNILGWDLPKEQVMRFPLYLCLITGTGALLAALRMKEPDSDNSSKKENIWQNIGAAFNTIAQSPLLIFIIAALFIHDTLVRLFLTTSSEYYRLIGLPESAFGIMGAAFAIIGFISPKISEALVKKSTLARNYLIVSLLVLIGLVIQAFALPWWGLLIIIPFGFGFRFLDYFTSQYLNANTPSAQRATVLSFKGLALNIGFGTASLAFAGLLSHLRHNPNSNSAANATDPAYAASLPYLPLTFLIFLIPLYLFFSLKIRKTE